MAKKGGERRDAVRAAGGISRAASCGIDDGAVGTGVKPSAATGTWFIYRKALLLEFY